MDLIEAWSKTKRALQEDIGDAAYEAWINRLQPQENNPGVLTLGASDEFSKNWIAKNYLERIEEFLKKFSSGSIKIELCVKPAALKTDNEPAKNDPFPEKPLPLLNLNPRYTFENFIVGSSNSFSHAASVAVSESPAKVYNPLFIYGGVGLGKTHLMQAICHSILKKDRNSHICYIPSEKFTNELISAIQHHSTARFRQKYRNADVLVIDDVHFIAGKESTQEEFFHTFNTLHDAHKQIIISSDRNPKDIPNLEERLVSRFGWGLVTDVQPPDFETRVAILKKKIEHEPTNISDEVIFFIAETVKTNIRELEGALIRVMAYSLLENKPISLELAKEVLKDFLKENNKLVTVDLVQKEVGIFFNLNPQDIKGNRRDKNTVFARQIAMYLTRELTNFSLPEIGGFFGGKDHTTVLHSYNKVKKNLLGNTKLKSDIEKLVHKIKQ
ncbi:MAG: chromosomal replication initiator protein DnaA [Candidatus Omnitrophota bacterium]|nr:chromosomal replication initiator protein DnaA [Candidatus Omnitrophota bacterium]